MIVFFWAFVFILTAVIIGMMLTAVMEYCSNNIERRVRIHNLKKILIIATIILSTIWFGISFVFFCL